MSGKKRKMEPFGGRPSKRFRKALFDDTDRESTAQILAESVDATSYLSVRSGLSADTSIPSLAAFALRKLGRHFRALYINKETGELKEETDVEDVKLLQPRYATRLLEEVVRTLPSEATLNLSVLSLFLTPSTTSFGLSGSLKASLPLLSKLKACDALTHLDLSRQSELKDVTIAPILAELHNLQDVKLRGCTNLGDASVTAIAKATFNDATMSSTLRSINLNFSAVTKQGLVSLLARASSLETLKMANLNGLTDAAVQSIVTDATAGAIGYRHVPLSKLKVLKLRSCAVSDAGVGRLLGLTPALESLDISFTDLHTLDFLPLALTDWRMRKLVLSGLKLRPKSLEKLMSHIAALPDEQRHLLKILKIGSMGLGRVQARMLISGGASIVDLDSVAFANILPALQTFKLESLSLHGNLALYRRTEPLYQFFATVAPSLKRVDMTGVHLSAKMMMGLLGGEEAELPPEPQLETLIFDNTALTDEAMELLQSCRKLRELHLAGCKITERGLVRLLEACRELVVLNLTGCRGVSLAARRDFFRAYERGELGPYSE